MTTQNQVFMGITITFTAREAVNKAPNHRKPSNLFLRNQQARSSTDRRAEMFSGINYFMVTI